jgi:apolipoprotein D and lipocalin family protein
MTKALPPALRPAHRVSPGTLAAAFALGGALTLLALNKTRAFRASAPAGPADGAPLMRAPLQVVA